MRQGATTQDRAHYLAVCGGIGGAKLALGLSQVLAPGQLTVVVNTGDDFEHMGLLICPDIDTVTYTLAGVVDQQLGWGRADERWNALAEVERLGGETWFRLGDKDLGLHLLRKSRLANGSCLSEVTAHVAGRFGIKHPIVPMSDDPVRTEVKTNRGWMPFQRYFVENKCAPAIEKIHYAGAEHAAPSKRLCEALNLPALRGVIICPSNPWLSIDPILSVPGVIEMLGALPVPIIAVSPIVGGQAIKGPTAKIMRELGLEVSAAAVAEHYGKILDGFVLDDRDRALAPLIGRNVQCHVCQTVMQSPQEKAALAKECLGFIASLEAGR